VWANGEWHGVPRVARNVKHRVPRLRALGNSVVPQVVELIGRAISQLIQEGR
jgi:site-specific DNA-cytosine methylase